MLTLPVTTQTAYAELLEQLVALEARRSIGHAPRTFVTKEVKGRIYHYFQYSTPGARRGKRTSGRNRASSRRRCGDSNANAKR